MAQATYREIGGPDGHLANKRDFQGNSMSARYNYRHDRYEVFSYGTLIAETWFEDGELQVSIPDFHYSKTTTRQQNLCRAWL